MAFYFIEHQWPKKVIQVLDLTVIFQENHSYVWCHNPHTGAFTLTLEVSMGIYVVFLQHSQFFCVEAP